MVTRYRHCEERSNLVIIHYSLFTIHYSLFVIHYIIIIRRKKDGRNIFFSFSEKKHEKYLHDKKIHYLCAVKSNEIRSNDAKFTHSEASLKTSPDLLAIPKMELSSHQNRQAETRTDSSRHPL
jgi:hypothetical protein